MDESKSTGKTSLATGKRVGKDSLRIEAIGALDELNASLGLARSLCADASVQDSLVELQQSIVRAMAELNYDDGSESFITETQLQALEERIEAYEALIPPFTGFVLPGDDPTSSALHLARTVARRAERDLVRLSARESVRAELLVFINRVSTYCFALARYVTEPS